MDASGEMFVPDGYEGLDAARAMEEALSAAGVERFSEAELAGQTAPTEIEMQEQREMDEFREAEKLGRPAAAFETIYYPNGSKFETCSAGLRELRGEKLGEYRIFCDTRPAGSRYDIFADGNGK